jgi:hypothetical protein
MKVQLSHRLDEGLAAWATEYGASRGTSRAVVIEEALRHFRELSRSGVPELPVVDTPVVREQRAAAAPDRLRARPMSERSQKMAREMGWLR